MQRQLGAIKVTLMLLSYKFKKNVDKNALTNNIYIIIKMLYFLF